MSILFLQFQQAYQRGLGPLLATTITPISPPEDENRLRNIYKSYDSRYTTSFIEESIITPNRDLFSDTEGELWVELYLAYWKAIVEILDAEDSKKKGSWVKAYEAWKEVANALIRGYGGGFQAWTVPCMYVVGRYLRIFAIKADQSTKGTGNNVKLSVGGLHDDLEGAFGKNETLEDAARQINRLFTLCLSDRYVEEILCYFQKHESLLDTMLRACSGHLWKSQGNGVSITLQTSFLRPISR